VISLNLKGFYLHSTFTEQAEILSHFTEHRETSQARREGPQTNKEIVFTRLISWSVRSSFRFVFWASLQTFSSFPQSLYNQEGQKFLEEAVAEHMGQTPLQFSLAGSR